jgi:hypothetical protein
MEAGARTDRSDRAGSAGAPQARRPPKDLDWTESVLGRESTFVLTPSRLTAIPILVFASLWDSFFVMLWMGLSRAHAPHVAFLFPIAHALVGVVVTWIALARCLNVTRIVLGPAELVVSHAPVPSRGERTATKGIERFDAHEPIGWRRKPWCVRALLRDGGQPIDLGLTLDGVEEVSFVAARLNSALGAVRDGLPA